MHSKKEPKHTIQELQQWQALPLSIKVRMTKQRIRDWINYYGEDGVYVSFSGGKDSTVLLDLVRQEYPNVVAVFVDTGLEFPEIRQFVKLFDNVEWVKPKMTFRQVIEKYGYPFISKEVSECVAGARKYLTAVVSDLQSLERTNERTNEGTICQLTKVQRISHIGDTCSMKPTECSVGIDISSLSRLPNGVASLGIVNLLDVANLITGQREKDRPEIPDNIACQLDSLIQNQYVQNVLGLKKAQAKNGSYWTTTVRDIPSDDRAKSMFSHEKYKFFLDAPFEISNMCCYVMKKSPAKEYEKRTGKWAFTAMMASESKLRTSAWLKDGCNGFDRKHPMSNPMAFWTEQDVLLYLRENHDRMLAPLKEKNPMQEHPWVNVYGEILTDDEESGQVSLFDSEVLNAGMFDFERPELHTTKENRTGCMFCGFGCHVRKNDGRFERMKESHPKIYKYLFGGERSYQVFAHDGSEIDLRHVDKEMLKRWVEKNQENRRFKIVWKTPPKGGLGYADVIDWINEHGNFNIKY